MKKKFNFAAYYVIPDTMDQFWPVLLPLLKKAFTETYGLVADLDKVMEEVYLDLQDFNKSQMWIVRNEVEGDFEIYGCALTEIYREYTVKCLNTIAVSGNKFMLWYPILSDMLDTFARSNNCHVAEGIGRPSWRGLVSKLGYSPVGVVFRKIYPEQSGRTN